MLFRGSTTVPDAASAGSSVGDPGSTRLVYLIVVLLVLIAAGLLFFAFTYWKRTRPGREREQGRPRAERVQRSRPTADRDQQPSWATEWDRDERAALAERAARERRATERRASGAGEEEGAAARAPRPRTVDPMLGVARGGQSMPRPAEPGPVERVRVQPRPAVRPAGTPPPKPAPPKPAPPKPAPATRDPRQPRPRPPGPVPGPVPNPVPNPAPGSAPPGSAPPRPAQRIPGDRPPPPKGPPPRPVADDSGSQADG